MSAVIVVSNMLVQYPLGDWLTWGALTFPFAFFVTDLATRLHGVTLAKRVIGVGVLVGIGFSFVASFFALTTLRIAIASAIAFFLAQLTDMKIFDRFRGLAWWKTPMISSTIGSILDTFIFFSIAFSTATFLLLPDSNTWATELVPVLGIGPMLPLWVSLALADLGIKLVLATFMLLPYRLVLTRIARLSESA
jgi:uncharacterized PurR-regulated membrane protein YhhQ (DUF165 family)